MTSPHRRRGVLHGVSTAVAVGVAGCASVVSSSNGESTENRETTRPDPVQLCSFAVVNDDDVQHEVRVRIERDGQTVFDGSTTVDGGQQDRPVADELPVRGTRVRGRVDGRPWRVYGLTALQREEVGVTCTIGNHREIEFSATDGCE